MVQWEQRETEIGWIFFNGQRLVGPFDSKVAMLAKLNVQIKVAESVQAMSTLPRRKTKERPCDARRRRDSARADAERAKVDAEDQERLRVHWDNASHAKDSDNG